MLEKMCAVAYYRFRKWYTLNTSYNKKSSTNQQQSVFASTYNSTTTLTPPPNPPYPTEKDRLLDPLTRIHPLSVPLLYSGSGSVIGDGEGQDVGDEEAVEGEDEHVLELSIVQRYVVGLLLCKCVQICTLLLYSSVVLIYIFYMHIGIY